MLDCASGHLARSKIQGRVPWELMMPRPQLDPGWHLTHCGILPDSAAMTWIAALNSEGVGP